MQDFLLRALIAGFGIALISAPLGCLLVWQRMIYFGATLSHSALLGIALGVMLKLNYQLSMLVICILISAFIAFYHRGEKLSNDTLLGILAHATLALGIILLAFFPKTQSNIYGYLFGDILSVTWNDIGLIYIGACIVFGLLFFLWRPLILMITQGDWAHIDGYHVRLLRFSFLCLLSLTIAISMQIIGVLLIISLLIIPTAAARYFANSPESMALFSGLISMISVSIGLWASWTYDSPAGPSIVVAATLLFLVATLYSKIRH